MLHSKRGSRKDSRFDFYIQQNIIFYRLRRIFQRFLHRFRRQLRIRFEHIVTRSAAGKQLKDELNAQTPALNMRFAAQDFGVVSNLLERGFTIA